MQALDCAGCSESLSLGRQGELPVGQEIAPWGGWHRVAMTERGFIAKHNNSTPLSVALRAPAPPKGSLLHPSLSALSLQAPQLQRHTLQQIHGLPSALLLSLNTISGVLSKKPISLFQPIPDLQCRSPVNCCFIVQDFFTTTIRKIFAVYRKNLQ